MERIKENGITLIALVVTIVVLLILAAVSIAMLTGENGIIKRASEAKEETEIGKEKEEVRLAYAAAKANKEDYNELVTDTEMNIELDNLNSTGTATGTTIITVTFESGRKYTINQETGEIEEGLTDDELKEKLEQAEGDCFIDEYGNTFSTDFYDEVITSENTFSIIGEVEYSSYNSGYNGSIIDGKLEYGIPIFLKQSEKIYKLTEISDYAFNELNELTSVIIPSSVTSIGSYAFRGCRSLTNITIPESVTSIGRSAFDDCEGLTSITIPDSVTSIEWGTFRGCSSLTNITIPDGVTSIGNSAFDDCEGLTSITIPDSVTSIGGSAFSGCSSLTNITIPKSVTSIGDNAFVNCSSLTNITIPESVSSIEVKAFWDCTSLTNITIPESVTIIEGRAFDGCSNLTTVNYRGTEEQWNQISIETDNEELTNATINYNYTGE